MTLQEERDQLLEAVLNFLKKWPSVETRIGGMFALAQVRSGVRYDGPTISDEITAMRTLVQQIHKPPLNPNLGAPRTPGCVGTDEEKSTVNCGCDAGVPRECAWHLQERMEREAQE